MSVISTKRPVTSGVFSSVRNDYSSLSLALRILAVDMVEEAKSGHPGLPLGAADILTVLFASFLRMDPHDKNDANRDRFVLSAGHGSAALYALLHLLDVRDGDGSPVFPIAQLRRFRKLDSLTMGHPEFGHTPFVETTTGPLGQGLATAVGLALAEKELRAEFGEALAAHKTYVLASDGDLMEGISHEACALAGHLGLANLVVLYDSNQICIDGSTSLCDSTNTALRFEALGFFVMTIDGHDYEQIHGALLKAQVSTKPVLIIAKTVIGKGAPRKQNTSRVHGSPLGKIETENLKAAFGWLDFTSFSIPEDSRNAWQEIAKAKHNSALESKAIASSHANYSALQERLVFGARTNAKATIAIEHAIKDTLLTLRQDVQTKPEPTRKSFGIALEALSKGLPALLGGSADLAESTNMNVLEKQIHYGIREHAMGAIMNGLSLHQGFIPLGSTFLVFSDYMKPAIRLASLMQTHVLFVFTHDSIGLGEDGSTHQPVEHLAMLRAIPGLCVFRPANRRETIDCLEIALKHQGPSCLVLSRQDIAPVEKAWAPESNICQEGAYLVGDEDRSATVTLIATGSELPMAVAAQNILAKEGIGARVLSMPCTTLFDAQPKATRDRLLRKDTLRIAVEAASPMSLEKYITDEECFLGMRGFGASAPYLALYEHFEMTAHSLAELVKRKVT